VRLATAAAWTVLPIVAGVGLYLLKMQVEAQKENLAGLQRQIVEARASIHVLKAEWSYLNDPVRLRDQAERLLSMRPVRPDQVVTYDRIPYPDAAPAPAAAQNPGPLAKTNPSPDALAAVIAALAESDRRKRP
jgi:hypothetical protein